MGHEKLTFKPEYYTGLNWRDALPLVGKVVEFSDDPDCCGWTKGKLYGIDQQFQRRFRQKGLHFEYIRTCPETHSHPTITLTVNGREWVLPRPETEAPERGIDYWIVDTYETDRYKWQDGEVDREWLEAGIVHLTEDRAQVWADFWQNAILSTIQPD